jgi:hypothetical protein
VADEENREHVQPLSQSARMRPYVFVTPQYINVFTANGLCTWCRVLCRSACTTSHPLLANRYTALADRAMTSCSAALRLISCSWHQRSLFCPRLSVNVVALTEKRNVCSRSRKLVGKTHKPNMLFLFIGPGCHNLVLVP